MAIAATPPASTALVCRREAGDAGDDRHPQATGPAGSVFDGVQGSIGGTDNPVDAFSFFYGGGPLSIQTVVGDPAAGVLSYLDASPWAWPTDPIEPPDLITPASSDSSIGLVVFDKQLAAGNYIVQISKAGSDPPFSITFFGGPNTGAPPAEISAPVPEPGTWALVALGQLAVEVEAIARRRRPSA